MKRNKLYKLGLNLKDNVRKDIDFFLKLPCRRVGTKKNEN